MTYSLENIYVTNDNGTNLDTYKNIRCLNDNSSNHYFMLLNQYVPTHK